MTVLERIRLNAEGFSRKMGVLAKFVVDNINDIGVIDINSAEIARRTGASEATITRFIQKLGYRNFPEFRAALRQQFHSQFSSRSFRMEQSNDSEEPVYMKVFNLERSLMEESLNMLDPMTFGRCVDMICSSEELLLVGCSPNSFLVDYA